MFQDLMGKRFGSRLVLQRAGTTKHNAARWRWQCDCGATGVSETTSITRSERCRSCKVNGFRAMPNGRAGFNRLYTSYKTKAEARGHTWGLSKRMFHKLTKRPCYYCGVEPSHTVLLRSTVSDKNGSAPYTYNGVDRKDNSRGYVVSNCVPCCETCNRAKLTQTVEEFEAWILRTANHIQTRIV